MATAFLLRVASIKGVNFALDEEDWPRPCRMSFQRIADSTRNENTVVMSVFDTKYAKQGAVLAQEAAKMGLPFVGFCREKDCQQTFWDACPKCHALVEECPNFEGRLEPWIFNSTRCHGWRAIQFHKVKAIRVMIDMGKNILFLDLDHKLRSKKAVESIFKRAADGEADLVALKRDNTKLLNFGIFYARATPGNRMVFRELQDRVDVDANWDQSAWNEVMQAEETAGRFSCLLLPNGLEAIEKGQPPRCGLRNINTRRNPKCMP